jgi:protocatechuate 4,5-dioxygenase beta chain
MARIVAGVGTSHVPAIGAAVDNGTTEDDRWKVLFSGYETARDWLAEQKPDVAIIIYNDHGSAFSLNVVPTFAVGVAPHYPAADEGYGPRRVPVIYGDPDLSWHLVEDLVGQDFDITVCQKLEVDHGLTVPMSILWGAPEEWPVRVIPIAVNVVQQPTPSAARCFQLGQAIRRAVESYGPDVNVAIVGTGGMSHQLQGPRAGWINSDFDRMFLEKILNEPTHLTQMSTAEYIRLAGSEGAELIMWLVMRGAMSPTVEKVHENYFVPASNTAAGLVVMADA